MTSAQALLSAAIDYAGLFPPTALSMAEAVADYARYRGGKDAWALGRFIVSAARLEEFEKVFASHRGADMWRLSALIGADTAGDIAKAVAFNQLQTQGRTDHASSETGAPAVIRERSYEGVAIIDTLEFKAATAGSIAEAAKLADGRFVTFHEIPLTGEARDLLAAIAGAGGRAKIRTGGVTADAFPEPAALARFVEQCAAARVPFKATAGLHHPIRGTHSLTCEAGSPSAMMHGFLNVLLAAAFARTGWNAARLLSVIEEQSLSAFQFGADDASWRGHRLTSNELQESRAGFLISFGSCSFEEPLNDLKAIGWL